ncbi:ABC transporter transmembrane domain-containing protein [Maridesulfovibrio sp.]|uniref:ABC transporter transmembrane domain-containing protein n=1 Tax=Maridesulfovibrio sp. TaxID=2795000 RepID=UPI0029C9C1E8|nr:ABC transporter transmembrane domain-containing protein [Maridesulfovibrio sp.]
MATTARQKTHSVTPLKAGRRLDILLLSSVINILNLAIPIVLLQIYDRILPNKSSSTAMVLFGGALLAIFIEAALRHLRIFTLSVFAEKYEYDFSMQALIKIFKSDLSSVMSLGTGIIKQRLNDITSLRDHYSGQTFLVICDLPFSMLFLGAIWYIGRGLVFVPLTLFLIAALTILLSGRMLRSASLKANDLEDDRINFATNIFNSLVSAKSIGDERMVLRTFRGKTQEVLKHRLKLDRTSNALADFIALTGKTTTIATVAVGAVFVIKGYLTTGGLAACTILAGRSLGPIISLMVHWTQVQKIIVIQKRIKDIWDLKDDNIFTPDSEAPLEDGSIIMDKVIVSRGDKKYSFTMYMESGKKVMLRKAGDDILPLFWGLLIGTTAPERGNLLVGGHLLNNYSRPAYRSKVAFISRHSQLFRGSILENISLFQTKKEALAIELAERIGLATFIHALPNGFRTQIGDMIGGPLEQGMIQRIAIVRALVNEPKILIFNEADEGIDLAGKKRIVQLLKEMDGPTIIMMPLDVSMHDTFKDTLELESVCTISSNTGGK